MINITDFQDILRSKTGGKPLDKVPNFYSLAYQAMLRLKSKVDLPSAMRTAQLTNPIYTDIYNYPIPADVSLNGIVMLRPIEPDITYIDFKGLNGRQMKNEEKFDTTSKRYGLRNINGSQSILIKDETTEPLVINNCDSYNGNGTFLAVGATTNVVTDVIQKKVGNGSVSFDVGVGSSNGVSNSTMSAVDLSSQNDILFYIYLPSISNLTGLRLSLGQSGSAYYQATIASDFFGNTFSVGWNLIRIPKATMSVVAGSPSWTGVIYMKLEVLGTYTAVVTGFKFDDLVAQIGALYEIDYYSDYQFQTAAGVRIVKPSAPTDLIVISGDEVDIYTDHFVEVMAADLKQSGGSLEISVYGGKVLQKKVDEFKFKFPSQRQLATTVYGSNPAAAINN